MEFRAYSVTYVKVINVAGGGLGNGNAYANIEIEYNDANWEEVKGVYYAEYGKNPYHELIGVDIDWGEDDTFNVIDKDGDVVNSLGQPLPEDEDDEDDEEEDDEDKDEEDKVEEDKDEEDKVDKVIRSIKPKNITNYRKDFTLEERAAYNAYIVSRMKIYYKTPKGKEVAAKNNKIYVEKKKIKQTILTLSDVESLVHQRKYVSGTCVSR